VRKEREGTGGEEKKNESSVPLAWGGRDSAGGVKNKIVKLKMSFAKP